MTDISRSELIALIDDIANEWDGCEYEDAMIPDIGQAIRQAATPRINALLLEKANEAAPAPSAPADQPSPDKQGQQGIPDGFRLLPVEATDSMMDAEWDVSMSEAHSNGGVSAAAWRAMVDAAPQVTYGNGHSGVGWYMHDTEYPEEGAVLLSGPTAGASGTDGATEEPIAPQSKQGAA